MSGVRNILFIMCDQLRWDYLSCAGHPHLKTPHLDALAAEGVRFDRAYIQSPVCGPSRMSYYTGRYMQSHGASFNRVPLKVGEKTIGDYLRPHGVRTAVVGKTHMEADIEGMVRLGIDPNSEIGVLVAEAGFEPFERDDGVHGSNWDKDRTFPYEAYLRAHGFGGDNPWEEWVNSVEDEDGNIIAGWFLKHVNRPARIPEEYSETPYVTGRAIDFIEETGDDPWCLHLSYIKPHWPYVVPAPYADMYGPEHMLPLVRSEEERRDPNPVFQAVMNHRVSRAFSRNDVRNAVVPIYMGMVKQIDDQMGRLFKYLKDSGRWDDTLIVFTSDHGDYLGDHWMGEKEYFHEQSVRVPMIVRDPRASADPGRGRVVSSFVESVDILPTFLDALGQGVPHHIIDGRSLVPLLEGTVPEDWRAHTISEYDYAFQDAQAELQPDSRKSWLRMIFDGRYKYIHSEGYPPVLYDHQTDPDEFVDLGRSDAHADIRARLHEALFEWARRPRQRTTIPDEQVVGPAIQSSFIDAGVYIGFADENELAAEQALTTTLPESGKSTKGEIAMNSPVPGGLMTADAAYKGVSWNILGQTYVPKQLCESLFSLHATWPPGTFVPTHYHEGQDEFFYILSGVLDFELNDTKGQAKAGDLLHLPDGQPHAFFNNGDEPVTNLVWVSPANDLYQLFEKIDNVSDPAEVVRISAEHHIIFPPPEN